MVSTPHREPHCSIRMRFPFLHMAVSHKVIAKEDVGLESLYRVISVLGGDRDRGKRSREEYRLMGR